MASVIIGDYKYTNSGNGAEVKVVDKTKVSYGEILSSVEIEGIVYPIKYMTNCFIDCRSLITAPEIPNSVTDMQYCFYRCTSLTTAPAIPNSVIDMSGCFGGCTSLTTAPTIPNSVISMWACFYDCTSLTTPPTIPNSVISMWACFNGCTSLTTAPAIPNSVIDMSGCFGGCISLTGNIIVNNKPTSYDNIFNETSLPITVRINISTSTGKNTWINIANQYSNVSYIYEDSDYYEDEDYIYTKEDNNNLSVKVIDTSKNTYKAIKQSIDGNIVTILLGCFQDCTSLTQAPEIPNSVIDIFACFNNCTSLTQAPEIPNSVTDIRYCFEDCVSLTQAPEIPNSITIMAGCFSNCTSLTQAPEIPNSIIDMTNCFRGCTSLTQAPEIPNSVIGMYRCFSNCTSLTQAPEIPNSVTEMEYCFYDCSSLTSNIYVSNILNYTHSSYYETIFGGSTGLTNSIYIINNSQDPNVSQVWRRIVSLTNKTNIHFEDDDHIPPTAIVKAYRTNQQGEPTSQGNYVVVEISLEIHQDNLPDGWVTSLNQQLQIDSITQIINPNDTRHGPYLIDDKEHIISYTVNDNYKTSTIQLIISKIMALLDFLGTGSQYGYIDIPGMGMAIGNISKRNGLDIQFPTTIGKELLPPTTWAITLDTEVDPNKTYYEKINDNYVEVLSPSGNPHDQYYYEKDAAVDLNSYKLTIGQYNNKQSDTAFEIGNGTADNARSNALTVEWDGTATAYPNTSTDGTGFKVVQDYNNLNTFFRAVNNISGVNVAFGIGAGGVNHGVYSATLSKWLIYGDNSNVYVNGANMGVVKQTLSWNSGTAGSTLNVERWGKVTTLRIYNPTKLAIGDNLVCTLPVGFRPSELVIFMLPAPNDTYPHHLRVTVHANGEVHIYNYKTTAISAATNASAVATFIAV